MVKDYLLDEDFVEKIILIILDKGLLAATLIILSFQISKRLEKYKNKLSYNQALSQNRLKIYSLVRIAIYNYIDTTSHYREILIEIMHDNAPEQQKLADIQLKFRLAREGLLSTVNENLPHISENVTKAVEIYFMKSIATSSNPQGILSQLDVSIEKYLYEALKIMSDEIIDGK